MLRRRNCFVALFFSSFPSVVAFVSSFSSFSREGDGSLSREARRATCVPFFALLRTSFPPFSSPGAKENLSCFLQGRGTGWREDKEGRGGAHFVVHFASIGERARAFFSRRRRQLLRRQAKREHRRRRNLSSFLLFFFLLSAALFVANDGLRLVPSTLASSALLCFLE